jgi:2-oxo-4-hydroxy-4-carboxy-5-ureidoimidazoline decarboxylase
MFASADLLWWSLDPLDWVEALGNGSRVETKGVPPEQIAALERAAAAYRERFSYAFVFHSAGHGVEQMVAAIEERLINDPDRELRVAAEEKRKVTRHKLEKLIGQ